MIKYPAPYARMRGMKGKLLGREQLEILLQASDVNSAISILKNTIYGELTGDLTKPVLIEHALKQDLILSYIKILTFLREKPAIIGKPARFVGTLLSRFELFNVKTIIRAFARESNSKETVAPLIFSLGRYHTIPIDKVLSAPDLETCIEIMMSTPFARPLEIGYRQYEDEKKFFPLEIALELDYYERLYKALDSLGPIDQHNAGMLLGIQYDITNLIWMLRFKQYYGFTSEQMFQYILPHGWKIGAKVFWKIADSDDLIESIVSLRLLPYSRLLQTVTEVDDSLISGVEICLLKFLRRQCIKTLIKFTLQAAPILAFFMLKEMEIRDIVAIITGKNMGLSQERIASYMINL